jgi:hypothetical protein
MAMIRIPRRQVLILALGAFAIFTFSFYGLPSKTPSFDFTNTPIHHVAVAPGTLMGGAIMPKLGNETLKAELGRASWKLFHTMMSRFPDKPTQDEREALSSYVHLFGRLYPWYDFSQLSLGLSSHLSLASKSP